MAEDDEKSKNLDEVLKPFYERASVAEVRLAKLESLLSKRGDADADNKEMSSMIKEYESKLQISQSECLAEREKVKACMSLTREKKASKEIQKLEAENKKLQYRVTHLIQALREADSKLKNIKT